MVTIEDIRTNLQNAIRRSGISQTEIARRLGVKQQTINCYLNSKAMPALDTLANLCILLDLDANEIGCHQEWGDTFVFVISFIRNYHFTLL